ncbi:MAG TPA: acetyl-coenzyme A synthetase N-terminal domain-containing protein, partial [Rubrivivax sp.]|nr:acetyl-coenzyme A synthetase N-terminal domain-containing protein [Rubrivivax sp.]
MATAAGSAAVPQAQTNPVRSRTVWEQQRAAALANPGAFHGDIAKRQIHWFVAGAAGTGHASTSPQASPAQVADSPGQPHGAGGEGAWLSFDDACGRWIGWDARTCAALTVDLGQDFEPWERAFNADDAPHWKWFEGGRTNACFNEVDRHVLAGFGNEAAFLYEGDRWDMSQDGGRGAPVDTL